MPGPPSVANLFTDNHVFAPYTRFTFVARYVWDEGLLQIPPAAAPGPVESPAACQIVRTSVPAGRVLVAWSAERLGATPLLPHPTAQPAVLGGNWVFARSEIGLESRALQADGVTHLHRIQGVYHYLLRVPVWVPLGGATKGSTPYDQSPVAVLSSADFVGNTF